MEANLVRLSEQFRLPYVDELIALTLAGPEKGTLEANDFPLYEREYHRLRTALELACEESPLPELPSCRDELNALLVGLRLGGMPSQP